MMFRKQVQKVETTGNRVVQSLNVGVVVAGAALLIAVVALIVAVRS
jgi:hypothetical protein